MGVHRSATAQWLQWTDESKQEKLAKAEEAENPRLDSGPFHVWCADSRKVLKRYLGIYKNLLIMGPQSDNVSDFIVLAGQACSRVGSLVAMYGGKDVAYRIFMTSADEADEWVAALRAAGQGQVASKQYIAKLQGMKDKQEPKKPKLSAALGKVLARLCCSSDVAPTPGELCSTESPPAAGASKSWKGRRYYIKSGHKDGFGHFAVHGDLLIVQSSEPGENFVEAICVRGLLPTVAGCLVSVRQPPDGLTVARLWLKDEEEADSCADAILEAVNAATSLPCKPEVKVFPSTAKRQLGSAISCISGTAVQAPCLAASALGHGALALCKCTKGSTTLRGPAAADGCNLDAECKILRSGETKARCCHATLRGDVLWLGPKWNIGDDVVSLCKCTAVAVDNMVAIYSDDRVEARLWPSGGSAQARQWAATIRDAGKLVQRGDWDAKRRKSMLMAEARRMKRQDYFRQLAEQFSSAAYTMRSMFMPSRRSATQLLMQWQEISSSLPPQPDVEPLVEQSVEDLSRNEFKPLQPLNELAIEPSAEDLFRLKSEPLRTFRRCKPDMRILELTGDVLLMNFQDGREDKPLFLTGIDIFIMEGIVSLWSGADMQIRIFFDSVEVAQLWADRLKRATKLLAGVRNGRHVLPVAPPRASLSRCSSHASSNLGRCTSGAQARAGKYISPQKRDPIGDTQNQEKALMGA